jgi:transcriptional regulator with XRE-family HTH domain
MDTQKITLDLLATGLTQQELAALVPCSQSLIAAFASGARGKQPSMVIGNSLLKLHRSRCTKPRNDRGQSVTHAA